MKERLQKYLARCGVASRRKSEEFITRGYVSVNGIRISQMGFLVDPVKDKVTVKSIPVKPERDLIYIMLNKPAGYITTSKDPQKRKTVMDLLEGIETRLFPIGRLDADSEGLLLLTNDGSIANKLTHPKYGIIKSYKVWVKGELEIHEKEKLEKGVVIEGGITAPSKVIIEYASQQESRIVIQISEGKKRQIRRMMETIGHPVSKLQRVEFAGISLGKLKLGEYRTLNPDEISNLHKKIERK